MKYIPMFKYRAKRNSNCEWVYGSHVKEWNVFKNDYIHFIVKEDGEKCIIDPSTLGVCLGMKDKNGKDVYTGHWLKVKTYRSQEYGPDKLYEAIMQVVWRPEFESFCLETKEDQEAISSGSNHYKYAFDPECRDNDIVYFTSQVENYEIEIIEEE